MSGLINISSLASPKPISWAGFVNDFSADLISQREEEAMIIDWDGTRNCRLAYKATLLDWQLIMQLDDDYDDERAETKGY